jgi:16S rRNA (cytosine1402-N4)-methyltransferase
LARLLAAEGLGPVDAILADLGLSSMQIDNPARGFTFKRPGPLDLRMNPTHGQPASALLAALNEAQLARALQENADEPNAARLAQGLIREQTRRPLLTTTDLAEAIRRVLGEKGSAPAKETLEATLRRVFQALRIEVNDEFSALETFLRYLPDCLKPGGRVAIVSFHSGEDRRVKRAFEEGRRAGVYARIAEEIVRPSQAEVHDNPRSSSAKLRWAVRA